MAAVSFTLLTSAARTSELTVKRVVAENFRPAYDILVRPAGSFTDLEKDRGLVRQNYLSGIRGGISPEQWERIKQIAGVEVAAPIANIGYIMPFEDVSVGLDRYVSDDPYSLYRVSFEWEANGGLSRYPTAGKYLYYTQNDFSLSTAGPVVESLPDGSRVKVCSGFSASSNRRVYTSPFDYRAREGIACYSSQAPEVRFRKALGDFPFPAGKIGVTTYVHFPVLLAAIDPEQEQLLLNLDHTIVEGRPLGPEDEVRTEPTGGELSRIVPVIASSRTYVDEELRIKVERLRVPSNPDLPKRLAQTRGTDQWARSRPGEVVGEETRTLKPLYDQMLSTYEVDPATWEENRLGYVGYWSPSDVAYERLASDRLRPKVRRNDPALTWGSYYGSGWVPQENRDTNFRLLSDHPATQLRDAVMHVLGRFDPELLPGFSELSEVPLETYYAPELEPADAKSRAVLDGRPLRPTQNVADYIAQPPLILTTLEGAEAFKDPAAYRGVTPEGLISVIRVRVADVRGPDPISRERIKNVAAAIRARTGLTVDITAGSSPRPMLIELPAGRFGRPELLLKEGWVEKGVAVRFLDAIDKKSVTLFVLILVICAFFLSTAALSSVRSRRAEIGTLICLGWSRVRVFLAIIGELVGIALVAGTVGAVLAVGIIAAFDLQMKLYQALLVPPVAAIVAVLAGALPAWKASRGTPLDALRPPIAAVRAPIRVTGLVSMAANNLRRSPMRAGVAASGLVVGGAALTLLLTLNDQLQGTLVGTLLGNFISLQLRTADVVSVLLVIGLGALSVADVLFVGLRERSTEFAALSAGGWARPHLTLVVALEAVGMGLFGSFLGASLGMGLAAMIRGVAIAPAAWLALGVAAGGTLVALIGCAVPIAMASRMAPAQTLAED